MVNLWAQYIAKRGDPFEREERWLTRHDRSNCPRVGSPEYSFKDLAALEAELEDRDWPMLAPAGDPEHAAFLEVERALSRMAIRLVARSSRARKKERERRERALRMWAFAVHYRGLSSLPRTLVWEEVNEALHRRPVLMLNELYCAIEGRV
jgi:hypothetical protein